MTRKKMENHMKNRRYSIMHSTIFRIIVVIIVLVLPINIMTIAFSTMVLNQSQEQLDKEIQGNLDSSAKMLTESMKTAVAQMLYVSFDDASFAVMANRTKVDDNYITSYQEVKTILDNMKQGYGTIDIMYFLFPQTGYSVVSGYAGIGYMDYMNIIKSLKTDMIDADEQWRVCDIEGTVTLISFNYWKNYEYGVLLNLERTLDKINLVSDDDGRVIFFTNADQNIFTTSGKTYFSEHQMSFEEMLLSDDYTVYISSLNDYDLQIVEIVEKSTLASQMPAMLKVMQVLSVVLAVSVIPFLLFYMVRLVNRPLRRLIQAIDMIEQGDLEHRIEETSDGTEFEQINRSFNDMMDQVQELKIDVYEKELERKDIKMQYLSQQIQPHFMLNAMNLLYSYEPEEYPLIQKMILCISKYFRYVVKMNSDYVELQQEMNHIKNYFEIQRARFPGLFFSIVEWDESLSKAMIPPLIIQNFAENSIKHSLKIGNKITIFVIADYYKEEGQPAKMRIRLADTGQGISDELIEKIEIFKQTGVHQDGLGVGIQNTIERLKYLHHDKATVRIWRDEHYGGTNVELIFPIYFEGDPL